MLMLMLMLFVFQMPRSAALGEDSDRAERMRTQRAALRSFVLSPTLHVLCDENPAVELMSIVDTQV